MVKFAKAAIGKNALPNPRQEPQPEKALYPMKITESRMVKLVKELQSSKASSLPVLLA